MKLKHKQLEGWVAATVADLTAVGAGMRSIVDRANADMDDGLKGRSYDGDGRGGSELTQPEAWAARTHSDQVTRDMKAFRQALDDARRAARQARRLGEALALTRALTSADDPDISRTPAGAGDCINCGHTCSGLENDRKRAGRCDACRMYRERHHGMDRPRELWASDDLEQARGVAS